MAMDLTRIGFWVTRLSSLTPSHVISNHHMCLKMVKAHVHFFHVLLAYLFNLKPPKLNLRRHPSTSSVMSYRNDF